MARSKPTAHPEPVEIYQGTGHMWRWRLYDAKGNILIPFSAHYRTREQAYDAAHRAAEVMRDWLDAAAPRFVNEEDTTPIDVDGG